MITLKNSTGKKEVRITFSSNSQEFRASYIQVFNNGLETEEQLLEMKWFKNEKMAVKWGNKILNEFKKNKYSMETKFFEFNQTNSGGHFDVDENVCHRVVIEATNAEQAVKIFAPMVENQSPSCPCCGSRWSEFGPDEIDLNKLKTNGYRVAVYNHRNDGKQAETEWYRLYAKFPRLEEPKWVDELTSWEYVGRIYFESIEQYYQYLANRFGWTAPDARIYYLDGRKKEIFINK